MARKVAYNGAKFAIAFAREASGTWPACDFFDALSRLDKAKLMALFVMLEDHGKCNNPEKFGAFKRRAVGVQVFPNLHVFRLRQ